ncbi:Uracil-DNA glycosylase [Andreprevotia lacus DSM 23236]|jgi:uracil-DNA glycosylase|uniref:Uracil-DNA glycosylase n=1 Tax=Andreprevotia lacus DSM 23236 TaxID=1121001 RepID=A0A1W1XMQ5_9NEIS|nr:uracil-DNA glycosylase [Andreprevotia lacus]SMC24808.1 Uracil-DNA glycosylase [Andreprevotia lacus DSM 23236]
MSVFEHLPAAWQALVAAETTSPRFAKLGEFLVAEAAAGKQIYPPRQHWFAALDALTPQDVKIVILGQDPYHGAGEAHGLAFSVPVGVKTPPSLRNIWQEIARDLGITPPQHGNLAGWARQGVLLLNTSLTVEADCAGSHAKRGWEHFTDRLIHALAQRESGIVFMLWGAHAQKKLPLIDAAQHCVLTSPHPSPLSAHRGFIGNGHFSAANAYLQTRHKAPIDWAAA